MGSDGEKEATKSTYPEEIGSFFLNRGWQEEQLGESPPSRAGEKSRVVSIACMTSMFVDRLTKRSLTRSRMPTSLVTKPIKSRKHSRGKSRSCIVRCGSKSRVE
jgi:hypothetical protein